MEQTFAEDGLSLVSGSWIQTAGGLGREFEFDESTLSCRYQEKQIRMTSSDACESHTPGEITLSEQMLLLWLCGDGRGQHRSVPRLTRQAVPPPCPVASRPRGVAGAARGMLSVAAASVSHPARWLQPYTSQQGGVDGASVDAKLTPSSIFTYLLARIVHRFCRLYRRRGGDGVRHGTDPHRPLYCPPPALRSPAGSVCSETVGFFWSMGLK